MSKIAPIWYDAKLCTEGPRLLNAAEGCAWLFEKSLGKSQVSSAAITSIVSVGWPGAGVSRLCSASSRKGGDIEPMVWGGSGSIITRLTPTGGSAYQV